MLMNNNIVLIGFMGCGKTTIGKRLATKLQYEFIDTDKLIEEKYNMKIKEIFSAYGEEYFRRLETDTIKEMIEHNHGAVIATGGGLPLRKENAQLLQKLGDVVLLDIEKGTVLWRLKGDKTRPLLQGDDFEQKVEQLLEKRAPFYKRAAKYTVHVDNKNHEEIIKEILQLCHHDVDNP